MVAIGASIPGIHLVMVPNGRPLIVETSSEGIGGHARVLTATSTAGKNINDPG